MKHNALCKRRQFLGISAALGMSGIAGIPSAEANRDDAFIILSDGDTIDIGGEYNEIVKKAFSLGSNNMKTYGGCARCTVGALQSALDFLPSDKGLLRGASCLDGGATTTWIASCGSFTGAGMAIGYLCGTDTYGDTKLSHKLIHGLFDRFKAEYGSVICNEVNAAALGDCRTVVGNSCRWTTELLLDRFAKK